jgi:hypothetical protein
MAVAPVASDLVRAEWLRRVQAEYTSAAVTQHLGLWLLQIGASPDLIKLALRIVKDELEHARLSHAAYLRARGADPPRLEREHLELRRSGDARLERDVARVTLGIFCLGETVAVPLFRHLREGCAVPVARRALDRILVDEVRHRDFGWLLLDWLLAQPYGPDIRALAAAELPAMFARLWHQHGLAEGEPSPELDAADRAWGLMSRGDYWAAVRRTLDRDWIPRFGERGIDARAAWDQSVPLR